MIFYQLNFYHILSVKMEYKSIVIVAAAMVAVIFTNMVVQPAPVSNYICTWRDNVTVGESEVRVSIY